ncbi:MAG: bifunctional phosphoribosylaminoimidazolecarboxamide formyltransferase/IMP cyclohydrolase [Acetobacter fabarum]|jgi:phosphoribosylaminoimidazolecarboxamide formyltransferase/IMP cyclohydrolase|uniref:bifunctional phosphoribosylaminoimidazolecarboxamide formyltransferase/IMP cyclohydrolase n=1 Tax=Acetobacter fabarum TaxID=483199 RepID=UPI00242EDAD1|nr:bifunctional phosphoribosylaminoimidazolecarboxamide formyltransferase/IMP cyclohydrolase [Acetobacter fabarum]MCH4025726.1 bifunctional phosphoribosylaminoimidazolecarboxamide formyltransferase/IMP cyclohydrolase [Acetobacter fabarum]MCH4054621.1 bifunctional phosphoribosylaminoimidazolecarboxamide formyltransferase/IMP cyclohydrolase [Acetobacter fabarum]MCH4086414.1 bifunctional phosphoribosylaminoimidazolecarboxamide formyltransferase/IMP cyclohydrolase [Acetobacter fabarum]MCH4128538.1 
MSQTTLPIRRALISVSDKAGLLDLARALVAQGAEILSTGGSAKALRDAGVPVTEVSDYTGFPEILDGRVKTLVPKIHGGILGRRDLPAHVEQMKDHGIGPIDLVAVNLYPFEKTVASGADAETCIENIDIGGPALIRAAAKNHAHVVVLTDPAQYEGLIDALGDGGTTLDMRRFYAGAAYARTAAYDAAIAAWFAAQAQDAFPERFALAGQRAEILRYGENPHQQAAFYRDGSTRPGVATAVQVQGKALSYNNINDTDAAFEAVAEFDAPAVVIVKHANPCGVAVADTLTSAWDQALRCDPVSAFGGIVALNRPLDAVTAEKISTIFTEVIVAPDAADDAKALLARKKNLRLLLTGGLPDPTAAGTVVRSVAGGFLAQTRDNGRIAPEALKVVTKRVPTEQEMQDLIFAFRVAKHVKSNAIVYAKDCATVGIGAGQMSRVDSARIAASKSGEAAKAAGQSTPLTQGSVAASDAFFPFADGLETIVAAGATAVIQPGGSIRDDEVIAAADAAGIAMVFTGMRHFRH